MRFNLHHYYHPDQATAEQLDRIETMLGAFNNNMEIIMSTFDDLKAALDSVGGKVTAVKADTDSLLAKLAAVPAAGLTAEQQAALDGAVTQAQGIASSLGAIDAEVNPPAAPAQ